MTSYIPDREAIELEKSNKEASGYVDLIEAVSTLSMETGVFRSETIVAECVAAGLVWDSEDLMPISMKNRGVTPLGSQFLELSDNWCGGPWHSFYIKPNMLQPLLSFLDNNPKAVGIVKGVS